MGCDIISAAVFLHWSCFNPRTHMGCDIKFLKSLNDFKVSIHAPTWGATFYRPTDKAQYYVSIHAPTWGATFVKQRYTSAFGVSIHAPTWGATDNVLQQSDWMSKFQSTHPHGVRLCRIKDFL